MFLAWFMTLQRPFRVRFSPLALMNMAVNISPDFIKAFAKSLDICS